MAVTSSRSWRSVILVLTGASVLAACTLGEGSGKKKKKSPGDWEDDFDGEIPMVEQPLEPDDVNDNSGAFGAGERPAGDASGPSVRDGGTVRPADAGPVPKVYCDGALAAGDLAIVEMMISSRSGSNDSGEWVEIQSTRDCWLKLQGVAVESPRGAAAPNVATISDDFELEPHGTFVVAGSSNPANNHGIQGKVVSWEATDVLKNDGDTVTVKSGAVQIDTLTYPAFNNLTPGRALSFPVDCAWSDRASWPRWSLTFAEFAPGFKGTPNADNADVACF
ncbi:MAG: hypothetical protein KF764_18490 [Labilithrix sp.]|nr:hypothetical protein [Labilithrix sp.]